MSGRPGGPQVPDGARVTGADLAPFVVGAVSLEPGARGGLVPYRLAPWARAQHEDLLLRWAEQTSAGVEVRVRTAATELVLTLAGLVPVAAGEPAPRPPVVVVDDGVRTVVPLEHVDVLPLTSAGPGAVVGAPLSRVVVRARRPGVVRDVVVHLHQGVRTEVVAIEADAPLAPVGRRGGAVRWTHHGSSISHGTDVPLSDDPWVVRAARDLGWELTDLAFAGNAQLDGFVARTVRDVPADVITLAVGINLTNADSMRRRAMVPAVHAFLDTVREGQPTTPVVLVQAISCPAQEDAPGPIVMTPSGVRVARRDLEVDDGALTLAATRDVLATVHAARAACDPHLHLLDGRTLLGPADVGLLHDGLHPDVAGHRLMAGRFPAALRAALGPDAAVVAQVS